MSKSSPKSTPGERCPKCQRSIQWRGALGTHILFCGEDPAARFWSKVDKNGPRGCWIWNGSRKPRGYGHMRFKDKDYNAHRWSYEQANGPIPAGMEIMHTCDVPYCVNPAHLQVGTHQENMKDCKAKGRHSKGETNTHAKLTEALVLEIRANPPKGPQQLDEYAAKYGVTAGAIYCAATGRTWRHL